MSVKKLSFGRLLQNDRLMIVLSLICAVGLWYFVLSGSTNVTTRTITCNLTTANVKNGNLQVIESQSIAVDVEVQGPWSELSDLTADDIRVQLNSGDIQSAGSCRIHVVASRNSNATDYEILSTSPSVVTLFCDEWNDGREFRLETGAVTAEAPQITAEGENADIGSVMVDPDTLPGGVLTVQGPSSVVDKIEKLTARVAESAVITRQQTFTGEVIATDSAGDPLDLTYCTLMRYEEDPALDPAARLVDMTDNALGVVVKVNERRDITFTYDVKNAPSGVDLSQIVTISPASVTLEGEKELLDQYEQTLSLLTTLDFDKLSTRERAQTVTLTLPEGIAVVGSSGEQKVTIRFDWTGYTTKTITWDIGTDITDTPIAFHNVPAGQNIRLLTNSLSVTVFGKREAISALKASDLTATVDMNNSSLGTYMVRPTVNSNDVWVFYGDAGYTVYLSIT